MLRLFLIGLAISVVLFVVTGGRVVFIPLLLVLPLGGLAWGRSSRGR
jgi:hypothetical protein